MIYWSDYAIIVNPYDVGAYRNKLIIEGVQLTITIYCLTYC